MVLARADAQRARLKLGTSELSGDSTPHCEDKSHGKEKRISLGVYSAQLNPARYLRAFLLGTTMLRFVRSDLDTSSFGTSFAASTGAEGASQIELESVLTSDVFIVSQMLTSRFPDDLPVRLLGIWELLEDSPRV
ncbi:hypothetical protein DFH11DRAFT_1734649 [Phellopilus nigrolimitatus]|nr:hypothetical protein DFH11DRAFT_1734649 [Phellopilus nigrolimitatus]